MSSMRYKRRLVQHVLLQVSRRSCTVDYFLDFAGLKKSSVDSAQCMLTYRTAGLPSSLSRLHLPPELVQKLKRDNFSSGKWHRMSS
jgi:hypothetical protein